MKTKIERFGIELEGEFSEDCTRELEGLLIGKWTTDGSINLCRTKTGKRHPNGHKVNLIGAEFVTDPLIFNESGFAKVEKLFSTLEYYEKKGEYHYNSTTGLHFHFSFTPKIPVEIWSWEFVQYFTSYLRKMFPQMYQDRTTKSTYCKKILDEYELTNRYIDRYKEINYKPAMEKHGTVEFRIFPATKAKTMQRYFNVTRRKMNSFIRSSSKLLRQSHDIEITKKENIRSLKKEVVYEKEIVLDIEEKLTT